MQEASATPSKRRIVTFIGPFSRQELRTAHEASAQHGVQVRLYRDEQEAIAAMGAFTPCGVFLHPEANHDVLYQHLRSDPRLFVVPTVETLRQVDAVSTQWAMWRGADDIVNILDADTLGVLIQKLTSKDFEELPPATAGKAVVAHFDEKRRLLIGRALRLGGFDVDFVANRHELLARDSMDILVVSEELYRDTNITGSGRPADVIIVETADERPVDYAARSKTAFVSDKGSLQDIVFLAAELKRDSDKKSRESRRLLFSAMCTFRIPGGAVRHGYVYNISNLGLFIRTLTPLAFGSSVWIEMEPYETGLVHLRGEVVRSREHVGSEGNGPAGFGVHIVKEECPPLDLEAYQLAYRHFLEATENGHDEPHTVMTARLTEVGEETKKETIPALQPTVLIIDDESSVCRSISRRLERAGYATICAGNGQEGLALLKENEVHAVVSDVTMPVLNGLELVNEMQSFARNVPIILLSGGYLSTDTTRDASKLVFDFLPKPTPAEKLLNTVAAAVRAYQASSTGHGARQIQSSRHTAD